MWPRIDTSSYESSRRWIGEKQKGKAQDVESGRGIWPEGNPGFVSFHRGNEGSGDVVGGVVSGVDRGPWTVWTCGPSHEAKMAETGGAGRLLERPGSLSRNESGRAMSTSKRILPCHCPSPTKPENNQPGKIV